MEKIRISVLDSLLPLAFCLLFFGIYLNQGGHNTTAFLSLCVSICYLFKYRIAALEFFSSFKLFYIFVSIYAFLHIVINLHHFGFGESFGYALQQVRWVLFVVVMLPAFYIFFSGKKIYSKKTLAVVFSIIIFFSVVIILDSLLRFYLSDNSIAKYFGSSHLGLSRPGWFYNPILFSKIAFFSFLVFSLLALFIKNKKLQCVCLILALAWFLACIITQVRSAWVAILAVFFVAIICVRSKKLSLFLLFLGFSFSILIVANDSFMPRIENMINASSFSEQYRLEQWAANLKLSFDHPLLGVGYAENRNPELMEMYVENKEVGYGHPHNQYLDIIAGVGYPAFILWLGVFFLPMLYGLKMVFSFSGSSRFAPLIAVSFNVFILIAMLFDSLGSIGWLCIVFSWLTIFLLYKRQFPLVGNKNTR